MYGGVHQGLDWQLRCTGVKGGGLSQTSNRKTLSSCTRRVPTANSASHGRSMMGAGKRWCPGIPQWRSRIKPPGCSRIVSGVLRTSSEISNQSAVCTTDWVASVPVVEVNIRPNVVCHFATRRPCDETPPIQQLDSNGDARSDRSGFGARSRWVHRALYGDVVATDEICLA
ncbi:hypothetical protein BD779DRAFT_1473954 [Infundibulicybe gibba]|nr:hypothetical protein BD779DRAFT_1473954 [Infundibulicybe gibba]